jgi:AcrR family transcriptional regulator
MMPEAETQAKREAILDAALEVFAEVGYERATIKAIAARAGIKSPALLYWYFPSKADIMRGVMSRSIPMIALSADNNMLIQLPTEQLFELIGKGLLSVYTSNPRAVQAFRLIFSETIRSENPTSEVMQVGPAVLLDLVRRNLQANIASGKLRPHDVEVSARMFLGSLILYVLGSSIITSMGEGLPPPDPYIEALTANLLDGLRASKD